jgi:endonuclease/exonuclease/phosphatase family metal-dependent hydrolase
MIKLITLNIHKGLSLLGKSVTMKELKEDIAGVNADIVCLQEVFHSGEIFESLSDDIWPHYAYGKNSIYTKGNHGNAILSKYPFQEFKNYDVSNHALEKRGLLHGVIQTKDHLDLHVFSVHLDLSSWGRKRQLNKLMAYLKSIDGKLPVIVAGDFNDWPEDASEILSQAGLKEAHFEKTGSHAKTYPTFVPMLKLDRIYYRGLIVKEVGRLDSTSWHRLSDHLPMFACFDWLP